MNVAQLYPAHTDDNGRTWYRPVLDKGVDTSQWGWTSDPAQAHPDYRVTVLHPVPDVTEVYEGDKLRSITAPSEQVYTFCETADGPAPDPEVQIARGGITWPETDIGITFDLSDTTTTEETNDMTAILDDGTLAGRTTEWMRYPLPPETPRAPSKFGQWGWYKLPHPDTGRPTGYPRATTVAKTLDDESNLAKWRQRGLVKAVLDLSLLPPDAPAGVVPGHTAGELLADLRGAYSDGATAGSINAAVAKFDDMMGGAESREFGECVHAWIEAVSHGIVLMRDVPAMVRPHLDAFHRVLARHGLIVLPQYVERTVLNLKCLDEDEGTGEGVAGKLDCILQSVATGELILGDVKTTKRDSIGFSWLTWACQIGGVYGWADLMLTTDGTGWEDMPDVVEDYACVISVPSDHPESASVLTMNKEFGGETLMQSIEVRARRKLAKTEVPKFALPSPTKASLRYVAARQALSAITSLADGEAVYETYSDVWDASLDEFAETISALVQ